MREGPVFLYGMPSDVAAHLVRVAGSSSSGGESPARSMVPGVPGERGAPGVRGVWSPCMCGGSGGVLGLDGRKSSEACNPWSSVSEVESNAAKREAEYSLGEAEFARRNTADSNWWKSKYLLALASP